MASHATLAHMATKSWSSLGSLQSLTGSSTQDLRVNYCGVKSTTFPCHKSIIAASGPGDTAKGTPRVANRSASVAAQATKTVVSVADKAETGVNPNTGIYPGFAAWNSVKQEQWEGELEVKGKIPKWLRYVQVSSPGDRVSNLYCAGGTYLRNGPGLFKIGEKEAHHLFDGFSTLLRLKFENGRLTAAHNQLRSDAYNAAQKFQKVAYQEFSAPPDRNLLARLGNLAGMIQGNNLTDNANTGVIKLGDGRVVCLTETVKGALEINPDTLETVGRFTWDDNLGGIVHAAHPYVDDKELITLIPDLFNSGYTVVRMVAGSNERTLIGKVKCRGPSPGWVHSFAVTENYIVVPEMPLRYSIKNLLKSEPCEYFKFEWMPETGAYMHIMDRKTGEVVTTVQVPNFVTFHFINAYEDGNGNVVADCCEHTANPYILQKMTLASLRTPKGKDDLPDARVGRFTIPLTGSTTGTLEAGVPPEAHGRGLDMNTINFQFATKYYRYVYACGAHRPTHFPNNLTKIDLKGKGAKNWYFEGGIPTEPFFVPRPGATTEDDGVVISVVSDNAGGGFVILMDGHSFTEIARADLPYGLPYGLHGCWVPTKSPSLSPG